MWKLFNTFYSNVEIMWELFNISYSNVEIMWELLNTSYHLHSVLSVVSKKHYSWFHSSLLHFSEITWNQSYFLHILRFHFCLKTINILDVSKIFFKNRVFVKKVHLLLLSRIQQSASSSTWIWSQNFYWFHRRRKKFLSNKAKRREKRSQSLLIFTPQGECESCESYESKLEDTECWRNKSKWECQNSDLEISLIFESRDLVRSWRSTCI